MFPGGGKGGNALLVVSRALCGRSWGREIETRGEDLLDSSTTVVRESRQIGWRTTEWIKEISTSGETSLGFEYSFIWRYEASLLIVCSCCCCHGSAQERHRHLHRSETRLCRRSSCNLHLGATRLFEVSVLRATLLQREPDPPSPYELVVKLNLNLN